MAKLTKQEIKEKYAPINMPKAKNPLLVTYRGFMKEFAKVVFGVGAIFLAIIVFPLIRLGAAISNLFHKEKKDFGIIARAYVSHTFRIFINFLKIVGVIKVSAEDKNYYRNLHKKIIVSNHPSMLDFVFFMSFCPNSTCIVRGSLMKTPLAGVIKQAYITNTTDFEELKEKCKKITDQGCNVIIFPEGTRTPRNCRNNYKKGAARLALYCGCDVQPIFIGGSDKYGLGKHDKLFSYNHVEKMFYDFKTLPVIPVDQFAGLSEPIAAKHLTENIEETIIKASHEYDLNHTCKTLNNV